MVGHLYGDIIKLFFSILAVVVFEYLIHGFGTYQEPDYLARFLFHLLAVGFGLAIEISTNFANLIGMIGDVCYILYNIDLEI